MEILSNLFVATIMVAGLTITSPIGPGKLVESDYLSLPDHAKQARDVVMRLPSGEEIGRFFTQGPTRSPLEMIPDDFIKAIIAIEDKRFLHHSGVDPIGISRAALSHFGRNPRGGSSIDQQLAKNVWTGADQSLERKLNEAILSLRGREILGARGILQAYVENVWFGRGITGAAGAAQAWFGKDWDNLSLGEIAYLAAILKGPAYFDGSRYPERALRRRNLVITAMEREGMITPEVAQAAREEVLTVVASKYARGSTEKAWIAAAAKPFLETDDEVGNQLISQEEIGLTIDMEWQIIAQNVLSDHVAKFSDDVALGRIESDALEIIATSDPEGEVAQDILRTHLEGALPWNSPWRAVAVLSSEEGSIRLIDVSGQIIDTKTVADSFPAVKGDILAADLKDGSVILHGKNPIEGAVVLLDPRDGAILATIGGANPMLSSFDRTRAMRQPGSAIKPFLWLAALNAGYGLETAVPDIEQTYMINGTAWRPRNYSGKQSGMVSLRSALEQSSNLVAAALIDALGPQAMADIGKRAGAYPDGMTLHPTAALGTIETSLMNLTSGYATMINDGVFRSPSMIHTKTVNGEPHVRDGINVGSGVSGSGPIASRLALEDMGVMLQGVIKRGTASAAFRNHPVSVIGKTGTTQGYRDGWFVGLTPHLAIGVWVGRDDNQPMTSAQSGGRAAAPIAAQILRQALAAGLIDENGYRDDRMTSGMVWPPRSSAPHHIGRASKEVAPPSARTQLGHVSQDPFWRVPSRRDPSHRIPDRNGGLRGIDR